MQHGDTFLFEPYGGGAILMNHSKIIAVDFDGTICQNNWPDIGEANWLVIWELLERKAQGDKIILWTCRDGQKLEDALMWCANRGLTFDAVNDNLPENIAYFRNNNRKVFAHEYWDDRAVPVSTNRETGEISVSTKRTSHWRKRGYWVPFIDIDEYGDTYECSECKNAFVLMDGTPKENNYNYCPNCGAKMEETEMKIDEESINRNKGMSIRKLSGSVEQLATVWSSKLRKDGKTPWDNAIFAAFVGGRSRKAYVIRTKSMLKPTKCAELKYNPALNWCDNYLIPADQADLDKVKEIEGRL